MTQLFDYILFYPALFWGGLFLILKYMQWLNKRWKTIWNWYSSLRV